MPRKPVAPLPCLNLCEILAVKDFGTANRKPYAVGNQWELRRNLVEKFHPRARLLVSWGRTATFICPEHVRNNFNIVDLFRVGTEKFWESGVVEQSNPQRG